MMNTNEALTNVRAALGVYRALSYMEETLEFFSGLENRVKELEERRDSLMELIDDLNAQLEKIQVNLANLKSEKEIAQTNFDIFVSKLEEEKRKMLDTAHREFEDRKAAMEKEMKELEAAHAERKQIMEDEIASLEAKKRAAEKSLESIKRLVT
jgi:chromosome segregation ATPase